MSLKVEFTPRAFEDLSRLDQSIAARVLSKVRWFAEKFPAVKPVPLTGKLRGLFKLRVGEWRVLYTLEEDKLVIHAVRHRREVYRS